MQDRAHQLADRVAARQAARDQGPEWQRQQRLRREGGGITQQEARRLAATLERLHRQG